ncbi:MAG TPA: type II secretion system protein [Gammaproteobacteria bacterium]|nr:type II secretion system protein [Gammaproteobacteria bacterium]
MFSGKRTRRSHGPGFTMMELVFVMVIAGVLAAVAIPRFVNRSAFSARGYYEELAAAARYAQQRAVAGGCHVELQVTASGFSLLQPGSYCGNSFGTPVPKPGSGGAFTGSDPVPGATGGVPATIVFNPDGSTDQASNVTVTVGGHTLTIHARTGYAETG